MTSAKFTIVLGTLMSLTSVLNYAMALRHTRSEVETLESADANHDAQLDTYRGDMQSAMMGPGKNETFGAITSHDETALQKNATNDSAKELDDALHELETSGNVTASTNQTTTPMPLNDVQLMLNDTAYTDTEQEQDADEMMSAATDPPPVE
eukprot:Selendium_serpulae@DN9290_c0_g1_i1.p1